MQIQNCLNSHTSTSTVQCLCWNQKRPRCRRGEKKKQKQLPFQLHVQFMRQNWNGEIFIFITTWQIRRWFETWGNVMNLSLGKRAEASHYPELSNAASFIHLTHNRAFLIAQMNTNVFLWMTPTLHLTARCTWAESNLFWKSEPFSVSVSCCKCVLACEWDIGVCDWM